MGRSTGSTRKSCTCATASAGARTVARIAYWQLDAKGVRDFLLINNTDSLYSFVTPIQYPKAGTTNSAARIGVVNASGGPTTWLKIPGDPRNNYLARMDWAGNATELSVEQLNRRQTQNTLWFANASTGAVRQVLVERDSAWLDIWDDYVGYGPGPSLHWFDNGASFLWLSERDGWRHAYLVGRDGSMRLVTPGDYDVMQVVHVDAANRWLYFAGSPTNATQLSLWRVKLDGQSPPERVTPDSAGGTHHYEIAPGGNWAVHTASSWGTPPTVDIVRLPSHTVARTLVSNSALKERLSHLAQGKAEFFRVDVGGGVTLDAWMMKPPNFDSTAHVSDSLPGVRRTGRADRARRVGQETPGSGTSCSRSRGTSWPAWTTAALRRRAGAPGERRCSSSSGRCACTISPRRPGSSPGAPTSIQRGWECGDGAEAGRRRSTSCSAPRTCIAWGCRSLRSLTSTTTTRSTRSATSGSRTTDSLAYRDASAINFVDGLRGDLLVVHGSGDDNVHFQGTEQLINAMIAAGKAFSMMEYPNRTHGIFEGTGTTVHLYNLLTRYLHEHLPTGPAASFGTATVISWTMIDAVTYGMIPSAKSEN